MIKSNILIVEDDHTIQKLLTMTLELHDYSYYVARNGEEALQEMISRNPDIVLLDLGLPDMDGIEVIHKLRSFSNVAIIVISARHDDHDKVEALDAGADDYLSKPFSIDELLARIRVSLRRIQLNQEKVAEQSRYFVNGDLKIDYASQCVWLKGEDIHLTPNEYKLLCVLTKNVGKVLTYNHVIVEVWGNGGNDITSLRVFMATLRKKIEPYKDSQKFIQTHIGVGYRMLEIGMGEK